MDEVTLDVEPVTLPPHVEVALYRIAQEALQNVVKHAGASNVTVRLARDADGVRLSVTDDGKGFADLSVEEAAERHSYGLVGIQERAELIGATLTVRSLPEKGTTVEVLVPDIAAGPPLTLHDLGSTQRARYAVLSAPVRVG